MKKSVYSPEQIILQELLRRIRNERSLLQGELAEQLGKYQTFVSHYETGEKMLDLPELRQVCEALGVTLIEFVTRYEAELEAAKLNLRREQ